MSEVKISIANGRWQISYEGSEDFLKNGFLETLQQLLDSPIWNRTNETPRDDAKVSSGGNTFGTRETSVPQMTMNNLCAKLECQTGTDLTLAACVYLTYMSNQEQLARREIIQVMKGATRYFKETYTSNLSSQLQTLVKQDKLMERSKDVYVLTAVYSREVEALLGQS